MTPLPPALAVKTLVALIKNWNEAIAHPATAKAVLLHHHAFEDTFIAEIVGEMMLTGGDWRKAIATARAGWRVANASRLARFCAWAEKLTRREPLLLEWKGGAR